MVGTSATDKLNPTNISWNGSALSLPAFLQKIRAPVLSHDPAFMTLIEKGIMINKSGTTVHSVLQALAHKSGLRTKGTWDKPIARDAPLPVTLPAWLLTNSYLTQEQKDAVIASNSGTTAIPIYAYPTSVALSTSDERRFTEQPEQLDQLDNSLFRTISVFINDATANALEKTCQGSGIALLTHLHDKADKSGDAVGAAAELQLSKMREGGIHDLQVESLNEFVESYTMWNAAQPASKVRAATLVHQDYISVFRKWGATVFNEYEIKRLDYARQNSCAHPSTDLDIELECVRLFLDERSTTEATARLQSGKALLGAAAAAPFDPNKNIRDRPAYDKSTDKRPPWHAALTNCRHCDGKHYNNSCHLLRENGGPGVPFKSETEQAARREKRTDYATRRKAKAAVAKKAKTDAAAAAAAPVAAPAPATGAGFVAGGTHDIETIVVPPGTAHTEPADSLIATLFGDGAQSLSLVDAGGSALWVANSLASGLEELAAAPQAPGEPMRGTIGRGGAAVMKGILKTSTTPSPPNPLQPAIDLATQIEQLEPHLAPGAPRERATDSSMRLYVDAWHTSHRLSSRHVGMQLLCVGGCPALQQK